MFLLFLIPSILGSPESDAKDLNEAFNYSTLITVIYEKKYLERQKMMETFRRVYGEEAYFNLWNKLGDLPKELSIGIIDNQAFYDAKLLNLGLTRSFYDEDTLSELMLTRKSQEIRTIKKAYKRLDHRDLCDDIDGRSSGDLKGVLLALCAADRDESEVVDEKLALEDCQNLYAYGPYNYRIDKDGINSILFNRNYNQLRRMFEIFSEFEYITPIQTVMNKRTIEDMIEQEYSFSAERALQQYIKTMKHRAGYFASLIEGGLRGVSGERQVIRTIFGRAGVDLSEIVKAFGGKDKLVESIRKSQNLTRITKQALIAILNANENV